MIAYDGFHIVWGNMLIWLLFLVMVILVLGTLFSRPEPHHTAPPNDPLMIAKRRYANGEISREEFQTLVHDLTNGGQNV